MQVGGADHASNPPPADGGEPIDSRWASFLPARSVGALNFDWLPLADGNTVWRSPPGRPAADKGDGPTVPEATAADAPDDVAPPPATAAVSTAAAPEKEDAPAPRRSRRGNARIIERFDPSPAPARADEAATLSPALPPVAEGAGGAGGGAAADGVEYAVVATPEAEDTRVGADATSNFFAALLAAANDNGAIAADNANIASASANAAEGVDAEAAVDLAEDNNHAKIAKDLLSIIKKKEPYARFVAHFNSIFPADNVPSGYSKIKPYTSRLLEDRFPDQKS